MKFVAHCLAAFCFLLGGTGATAGAETIRVDLSEYHEDLGTTVTQDDEVLKLAWPVSSKESAWLSINLRPNAPLIESLGISTVGTHSAPIATALDPATWLTIGKRDAEKAARGMVFFDNPRERAHETHLARLTKKDARVSSHGARTTISVGDVTAGSFQGEIRFTVYRHSPLIHVETVLTTEEPLRAIVYDAGLTSESAAWQSVTWLEPHGTVRSVKVDPGLAARPLAVKHRVIAAESEGGSLAVFPAPHRYFYPLDFADNFEFTWVGSGYGASSLPFGLGIRQPLEGDKRWVPWFDAPPGTEQRLDLFYLLSSKPAEAAIDEVAAYTRGDRFKKIPGHITFTSHYHIEHTVDYLERQKRQQTSSIPKGLEAPGFVAKFKETGIDAVHLAEFHFGWTPGQKTAERLSMLKTMHEECKRLSDEAILILPGEEPNVHLGGHWISFFPKPVYWVLNRAPGEPFVEEIEPYGKVYRVGSPEDVLRLMQAENGLMWTAHARIKSSLGFPDRYRDTAFYKSDHFLGAAWKAMPADLSRATLGWRILDLLDDMNQWGQKKQILGEVDVFRVEPDYELYAHMNINYLRLDNLPKYEDGWDAILQCLRAGEFFVTTGEVLIPQFTIGGRQSGETLELSGKEQMLEANLEWTFPLAYAEIVSGDGENLHRQRIDLSGSEAFGTRTLQVPVDLEGRSWVRFEVWDIAANGAFTQPIWLKP